MKRLKTKIDQWLGGFVALAMALAVATVLWQVFTRYVLGDPSSFTDELVRYVMIWIGMLGAAFAAGQRLHLAIDLLPSRLEGRSRHLLDLGIQVLIFAFASAVMLLGGLELVQLTLALGQTSAALGVPLGWVYLVLPLAGLFLMFYSALFAAERLHLLRGGEPRLDLDRLTGET